MENAWDERRAPVEHDRFFDDFLCQHRTSDARQVDREEPLASRTDNP